MKVIMIGAGAAGLFAASMLAGTKAEVVLYEKNEKPGKKLYITGKGRCNFTNHCDFDDLIANVVKNPKFLYSAFRAFGPEDAISYFEGLGLKVKEERGKRMFPQSDHSSDVIKALSSRLKEKNIKCRYNTAVEKIRALEDGFAVTDTKGKTERCDKLIIATGGLSYVSTGSDGDGYRFAKALSLEVTATGPSLVPYLSSEDFIPKLCGLSLKNVTLTVKGKEKEYYHGFGEMLFTDKGISGPLVLSASAYTAEATESLCAYIDLKPALDIEMLDQRLLRDFEQAKNKQFKNALSALLPSKLQPVMVERSGISPETEVNSIKKELRKDLCRLIKAFPVQITGTAGYKEAVITRGGISVKELRPSTMEVKKIPGLYFIGEVIDTDALTGGFNLQIAWSTAHAAAADIIDQLEYFEDYGGTV